MIKKTNYKRDSAEQYSHNLKFYTVCTDRLYKIYIRPQHHRILKNADDRTD